MSNLKKLSFCFSLLNFCMLFANENEDFRFAYISYSTTNVGDDIQAIAAKRFLPPSCINLDRDLISEVMPSTRVKALMNGWYMHGKNMFWERFDRSPPEKAWPPAAGIDPFFISIHLDGQFVPTALSEEGVAYFKQYAPIGARDLFTLEELQKKDIPSYFSGCLTLTLDNPYLGNPRDEIVYLVDLDEDSVRYIKSKTKCKVITVAHCSAVLALLDNERRLKYAEVLLDKYRKAKCVVANRLHVILPCLAFETPVLSLCNGKTGRFSGLSEIMRSCSREELLAGEVDFDFDNPPENSKAYLPIRENLIKLVTDWVNTES
ncbi:MAG: polysaccharide pyruvyl transferase family protein [Verrucomicrobia bacterium]|nr:polysaccharide pyruvyl transferase family protein [Verrucomicrobiota bacterium]